MPTPIEEDYANRVRELELRGLEMKLIPAGPGLVFIEVAGQVIRTVEELWAFSVGFVQGIEVTQKVAEERIEDAVTKGIRKGLVEAMAVAGKHGAEQRIQRLIERLDRFVGRGSHVN